MKFSIRKIIEKINKIIDNTPVYGNKTEKEYRKQGEGFLDEIKIEEKIIGDTQNGIREKYKNGILLSKTPYTDGRIDGKVYTYFEDGNIESIQSYKSGVLHGLYVLYDRKGNITYDSEYDNGNRVGHGNLSERSCVDKEEDRHI